MLIPQLQRIDDRDHVHGDPVTRRRRSKLPNDTAATFQAALRRAPWSLETRLGALLFARKLLQQANRVVESVYVDQPALVVEGRELGHFQMNFATGGLDRAVGAGDRTEVRAFHIKTDCCHVARHDEVLMNELAVRKHDLVVLEPRDEFLSATESNAVDPVRGTTVDVGDDVVGDERSAFVQFIVRVVGVELADDGDDIGHESYPLLLMAIDRRSSGNMASRCFGCR